MSRSSGHYAGGCCCKRHRPKGQNYGDGYRYRPRMRRRRTHRRSRRRAARSLCCTRRRAMPMTERSCSDGVVPTGWHIPHRQSGESRRHISTCAPECRAGRPEAMRYRPAWQPMPAPHTKKRRGGARAILQGSFSQQYNKVVYYSSTGVTPS